jgi:hypothetical protein
MMEGVEYTHVLCMYVLRPLPKYILRRPHYCGAVCHSCCLLGMGMYLQPIYSVQ